MVAYQKWSASLILLISSIPLGVTLYFANKVRSFINQMKKTRYITKSAESLLYNYRYIIRKLKKSFLQPTGTKFSLNDLFTGIEWNHFEKKDRLLAGRNFFALVEDKKISDVESNGKTSGNKQIYIKK